jgi:hypothetical protein
MEEERRGEISWSLLKYFLGKEGIRFPVEGSEVWKGLVRVCPPTEAKDYLNELIIELVKENLASELE